MTEQKEANPSKVVGRTWVDLVFSSGYGLIILGIVVLTVYLGWRVLGSVPEWLIISLLTSLAFIPFLFERAKEDSKLFIVVDEPMRLSEYRIGSKVDLDIQGIGVQMLSKTGVRRTVLKSFNIDTLEAVGSPLGEYSQFEQIRNLSTLQNLTNKLEEVLKEDRLTSMQIGVEVENQNKRVVDWALRFAYGSIIPEELSEALNIQTDKNYNQTVEDLLEVDES